MNPPPPIPAPEGEVPPRIFVGRQWADERFKSGTWRKEQAAFYAVPFVPEAALSAEKQRGLRAVEEARRKALTDAMRAIAERNPYPSEEDERVGEKDIEAVRILLENNEHDAAQASRAGKGQA